jgi:Mrp family chromosome partitioning ATPase
VSFASAGSHTLLIDCDLVGGGLTNRMQAIARRKLGQLLERKGLVTRQQVDDAMKLARSAGRKLGEALVEAGYIHQQEIATALAEQEQNPLGLLDALSGENLEDCAADTGIPHLHVLPLGTANAVHAGTLSPAALRRLVEAARERYDTIIVDTGPILGSLEAASVASVADGVILTVSCGEQRPTVEQSIQYLETVGAHLAGIVFNRARRDEIHRLVSYSASSSLHRSTALARRTDRLLGNDQTNRLGPVAGAVAAFAPPRRNGNGKRE